MIFPGNYRKRNFSCSATTVRSQSTVATRAMARLTNRTCWARCVACSGPGDYEPNRTNCLFVLEMAGELPKASSASGQRLLFPWFCASRSTLALRSPDKIEPQSEPHGAEPKYRTNHISAIILILCCRSRIGSAQSAQASSPVMRRIRHPLEKWLGRQQAYLWRKTK